MSPVRARFIARLGADEFGLLVNGSDDPIEADEMGERVLQRLCKPFQVQGSIFHLGASIGVVLCPGLSHFEAADDVLKGALLALQHAKQAGGRRQEFFQQKFGQQADERRQIEDELRQALVRKELRLFFQPQVMLRDGSIIGAEALLRWEHPIRGLLSPAAFLPVLELSDTVIDVGRWILSEACAFAAELAAGGTPIRIGVNLFAAQLRDGGLFDDVVAAFGSRSPAE